MGGRRQRGSGIFIQLEDAHLHNLCQSPKATSIRDLKKFIDNIVSVRSCRHVRVKDITNQPTYRVYQKMKSSDLADTLQELSGLKWGAGGCCSRLDSRKLFQVTVQGDSQRHQTDVSDCLWLDVSARHITHIILGLFV